MVFMRYLATQQKARKCEALRFAKIWPWFWILVCLESDFYFINSDAIKATNNTKI